MFPAILMQQSIAAIYAYVFTDQLFPPKYHAPFQDHPNLVHSFHVTQWESYLCIHNNQET